MADEMKNPNEALDDALSDASFTPSAEVVEPDGWWRNPHLVFNAKGTDFLAPNVPAIVWWLEHPDCGLSNVRYNVLTNAIDAELLPWNASPHVWDENDMSNLFGHMQELTNTLLKNKNYLADAFSIVVHRNEYNPLLDMLDTLEPWDGVPRADTLLIDFLGAEDSEYTRAVTRHLLYGMAMRAYHPGCKFDECVTLVSPREGLGKSTFVGKLPIHSKYYCDTLGNISTKEAGENMQGKWVVEIGELEGIRGKDEETVKFFLSKREDRFRASYARVSKDWPRRCVFVATTNSTAFLKGKTGNRRFLCVMCDVVEPALDVFDDMTPTYMGQVWAEVLSRRDGDGWLPLVLPKDILRDAMDQRERFSVDDTNGGIALAWVEQHCRPGEPICLVQLLEVAFEIPRKDMASPQARKLQSELSQFLDLSPEFERVAKGKKRYFSDQYGRQRQWLYKPSAGGGSEPA